MAQDSTDFTRDPRVYFAAERTFLAWIRTGLSLMGFGFVVARFGLFLREMAATRLDPHLRASNFSSWMGTALIMIGVIINVSASIRHVHVIDELRRGSDTLARPSYSAIIVAIVLAIIGAVMSFYLLAMR